MTKSFVIKTIIRPLVNTGQTEVVAMSSHKVELMSNKGLFGARVSSGKDKCCIYSSIK